MVPRLKKALRVPTPADRGPGRPWRPGTPPPAPIEVKAHAPHRRVIFTVSEMKRLGRDAAELTALADHLTAHGVEQIPPSPASIGRSPNTPSARRTPKPSNRPTPTSPPFRSARSPDPAPLSLTAHHIDYREPLVTSP
jgi:hypothetical protein